MQTKCDYLTYAIFSLFVSFIGRFYVFFFYTYTYCSMCVFVCIQTDLHEKSDFWKWNFGKRTWSRVKGKANKGPGGLHGHTAVKTLGAMILFGGEREGRLLHDVWRFHFYTEAWERLSTEGMTPNARCRHTAVANPLIEANIEDDDDGEEEDIANANIVRSALKPLDNRKAGRALMKPTKSISMCFGAGDDKIYTF